MEFIIWVFNWKDKKINGKFNLRKKWGNIALSAKTSDTNVKLSNFLREKMFVSELELLGKLDLTWFDLTRFD